jgi:hypothetical protein
MNYHWATRQQGFAQKVVLQRHIPLERLRPRQQEAIDEGFRRRVHPPLPGTRAA